MLNIDLSYDLVYHSWAYTQRTLQLTTEIIVHPSSPHNNHNNHKLETAYMLITQWMDKNQVHSYIMKY